MNLNFDFQYFLKMFQVMSRGYKNTFSLAFVSLLLSILLGCVLALVRYYNVPVLKQISIVFTSFFRSTPFIGQIFIFYYGFAQYFRTVRNMKPYTAVVIVLSLSFAAYMGENIRGAFMSVDHGQFEAGLSIGLSTWQTIRRIIIPQAARVALPGMANTFANLFKSTSMAFTIGVVDMTTCIKTEMGYTFRYLEGYLAMALVYWAVLSLLSYLQSRMEKKLNAPYKQA